MRGKKQHFGGQPKDLQYATLGTLANNLHLRDSEFSAVKDMNFIRLLYNGRCLKRLKSWDNLWLLSDGEAVALTTLNTKVIVTLCSRKLLIGTYFHACSLSCHFPTCLVSTVYAEVCRVIYCWFFYLSTKQIFFFFESCIICKNLW